MDKYFVDIPENYTLNTEIITKSEYGSHKIKISDLYNENLKEKIITNLDIENATDKRQYYGAIVKGYELPSTTQTDIGWKILYADKNNIYLIADNYIEKENLPNSTTEQEVSTTNKPNDGTNAKAAYFNNILVDYTGSERIKDKKLKKLNDKYFYKTENGKEIENFASTDNNMKSVAYMMDITAWNSKFKDTNNKAEYAIGGPTIEMLIKSYNQKYKVNYQMKVQNSIGYEISKDGGKNWGTFYSEMLSIKDDLYVISSIKDANAMWLASPSNYSASAVMAISCGGAVIYNGYANTNTGFRPVIALKSDVKLQENIDGSYSIK